MLGLRMTLKLPCNVTALCALIGQFYRGLSQPVLLLLLYFPAGSKQRPRIESPYRPELVMSGGQQVTFKPLLDGCVPD